ncbi:S26 family signal peptidase [Kitasatospora sp. NPDC006786]|uniref:S26 family signal peptidase n=1 Tax=unclassified Kitasatospora TaxID=2633591 RepID=UPI0033EFB15E
MHPAEIIYLTGLALAVIAVTSLTYFVRIATESMAPTLIVDDRLLVVRRPVLTRHCPARGQVVVFTSGTDGRRVVKRVAATGGDSVLVGGSARADGSIDNGTRIDVPLDGIFVLGDNRRVSRDSREYGCISSRQVTGRAVLVVWPPRRLRVVR